jgi:hypothetical protein
MVEDKLTFAAIVLVAIVAIVGMIGLMGFGGLTGGSVAGTMNVTLSGTADIILTDASTSFGTGYVNASFASATINSEGTKTNWINTTAFPAVDPMTLENNGTRQANVTIKSDKSAATFIGGTGPTQSFKGTNSEAGSCTGTLASVYGAFDVTEINLCSKLEYIDANDTVKIDYQLVIPSDAAQAAKGEVLTFTAYAA